MEERKKLLEVKGVVKTFPGVKALDGVQLELHEGEVVALVGENGAGKSTFMNILVDAIDRSSGEILYNGKETISMGKDYEIL